MDGETENKGSKSRVLTITVLALVVLIAGGYFFLGRNNNSISNGTDNTASSNVAGIATVNGTVISKETYDVQLTNAIASYKAQGVDATTADKLPQLKQQVLSNLINNELLSQSVLAAGIKSKPEEVEAQFQLLLTQSGGADAFKAQLTQNNLTEAQLRENISKQLAVQAYLLQNVDTKSITVSDAEIKQFYDDYSKAQKDSGQKTVPALKDLTVQIQQQLTSNKQQALVANFLTTLQTKSKIEITGAI